MRTLLFAAILAGSTAVTLASDKSIEVTLEDGPMPEGPQTVDEARARGKAEAEKDIKAGRFRVKDYGKPARPNETDPVTGYPIEYIGSWRERTPSGEFEVTAYNRTMREWHAKHAKKHQ